MIFSKTFYGGSIIMNKSLNLFNSNQFEACKIIIFKIFIQLQHKLCTINKECDIMECFNEYYDLQNSVISSYFVTARSNCYNYRSNVLINVSILNYSKISYVSEGNLLRKFQDRVNYFNGIIDLYLFIQIYSATIDQCNIVYDQFRDIIHIKCLQNNVSIERNVSLIFSEFTSEQSHLYLNLVLISDDDIISSFKGSNKIVKKY